MREWEGVLRTNKRLRRKEGSWEAGGTIIYLTPSFYLIIPTFLFGGKKMARKMPLFNEGY